MNHTLFVEVTFTFILDLIIKPSIFIFLLYLSKMGFSIDCYAGKRIIVSAFSKVP